MTVTFFFSFSFPSFLLPSSLSLSIFITNAESCEATSTGTTWGSHFPPEGCHWTDWIWQASDSHVTPKERVSQYPQSGLTVDNGELFCTYCRQIVKTKKSTVEDHLGSLKHAEKKVIYEKHEKKQDTIANQFAQYKLRNSGNLPSGATLPDRHIAHRTEVLKVFIETGTPIHRLPRFRYLLEKAGFSLTDESHLCNVLFSHVRIEIEIDVLFVTFSPAD